ncbi:MAG: anaerobic ribonucleoside-triphosphate reductase activating protein [Candidatus Aenigmarchaeota archaeon]|nr:anaerobic ribonucleoside-triphosphate reductase activating protein [Candidatus Aenigmarchaeota archaeon]
MKIRIGGILDFSSLDYPKKMASVVFFSGCNFRCPFCHNPELVDGKESNETEIDEIVNNLANFRNFIEGVAITGGEPTLQPEGLKELCSKLKAVGLKVKLDTNGSNPDVLRELLEKRLLDFIAMDVKAPFEKESYDIVSKGGGFTDKIKESYKIILESGIPYEMRMPVVPGLNSEMMERVSKEVKDSDVFVLEQFSNNKCYDPKFEELESPSEEEMEGFAKNFTNNIVRIRTKNGEKTISK